MKTILRIIYILLFASHVYSADSCSIYGKVIDPECDASRCQLYGAIVQIENENIGVLTDTNGEFCIKGLTSGKYLLKITTVGYSTELKKVTVNDTLNPFIEIKMKRKDNFDMKYPFPDRHEQRDIIEKSKVESGTIKGTVYDSSVNATLPNIIVSFIHGDNFNKSESKIHGQYELELPVGNYSVMLNNTNSVLNCIKENTYKVQIYRDSTVIRDFSLTCRINPDKIISE